MIIPPFQPQDNNGKYASFPLWEAFLTEQFGKTWKVYIAGEYNNTFLRVDPNGDTGQSIFYSFGRFGKRKAEYAFLELVFCIEDALTQSPEMRLTDDRKWVREL